MLSLFGVKSYITLGLIAVIAIAVASCLSSCNKIIHPKPVRTQKTITREYDVVNILNGATIEVKAGILKSKFIYLKDISCPSEGQPFFNESIKNLALSCGPKVKVITDRGIFSSEEGELDSRCAIGVCYGASGINLQIDQIEQGFARCKSTAPKEWLNAEEEAKQSKRGVWKK